MIELAYPWALMVVFLPLVIYLLLPIYKERRDAVQVPYFNDLVHFSGKEPEQGAIKLNRNRLQRTLLLLGWLSLVLAIAKPEWVGEPIEREKSARDIMIALDLSGSMIKRDFKSDSGKAINRLEASKQVLSEFAMQRKNDRLGLILFGDEPYLQAPLTNDIDTWLKLLNQTTLGIAGWQTAIGDAIGLSINVFENEKTENRVLILLSDGDDTVSKMPPLKAAEIAKKYNVKIYTVAMGDPSAKGEYRVDIEILKKVAQITGGDSFHALNRSEMQQIYQKINDLEEQLYSSRSFRPRTSIHHLPLSLYVLINMISFVPVLYRRFKQVMSQDNIISDQAVTPQGTKHG